MEFSKKTFLFCHFSRLIKPFEILKPSNLYVQADGVDGVGSWYLEPTGSICRRKQA